MKPWEAIDLISEVVSDLKFCRRSGCVREWTEIVADAHALSLAFPDISDYLEAELSLRTNDYTRAIRQYRKIWRELERGEIEREDRRTKVRAGN